MAAGVGVEDSVTSACLSDFPRSERKRTGAIDGKLGRPIVHGTASACTGPEVRRSKVKVKVKFFSSTFALTLYCGMSTRCKVLKRGLTGTVTVGLVDFHCDVITSSAAQPGALPAWMCIVHVGHFF